MWSKRYDGIGETLYGEKLKNGLEIRVLPRPGFQKSVAFFAANYGSVDRRFQVGGKWIDTPAGVAHFLEHKMFDTKDGNALSLLSANGASPNAFTSFDLTAYHFESTTGFYDNLRVLLDFVSVPYFTPESVQKEQGIIGQEIQMYEDSPEFQVYFNLMRCLFSSHPIRDDIAGSVGSIAQITDKTLYDCHRVFYSPSNMCLCVMGDAEPQKVADIAREILPGEPTEIPKRDYGPKEPPHPEKKRAERDMEVAAPLFAVGARYFPARDTLEERLTAELSMDCLLGESAPLYNRLYAEGLINQDFGCGADIAAGTVSLLLSGESRAPDAVLGAFVAETRRVGQEGVDPSLLDRARRAAYGRRLRALGSFLHTCQALAEGCFANFEPLQSFEILNRVGAEDIRRFVQEKLDAECVAISIVYPKAREENP